MPQLPLDQLIAATKAAVGKVEGWSDIGCGCTIELETDGQGSLFIGIKFDNYSCTTFFRQVAAAVLEIVRQQGLTIPGYQYRLVAIREEEKLGWNRIKIVGTYFIPLNHHRATELFPKPDKQKSELYRYYPETTKTSQLPSGW